MTETRYSGSESEQASEEWRAIPGWEGLYSASSLGRIRTEISRAGWKAGRILSPAREKDYDHVRLCPPNGGRVLTRRVHILVALAFIGPKPGPGWEVNHRNGTGRDNRCENLEYVTKRDNESHAARLHLKKWKPNRGRLNTDAVRAIRQVSTFTIRELAARFGVSQTTIYNVRSGRTWKRVA